MLMDRIVLLENNEMLRFRIENVLNKKDDICVESIVNTMTKMNTIKKMIQDSKQLIIDIDNVEGYMESVLGEIRSCEAGKNLPILLISSHPDLELIITTAKFGKIDVLLKPFKDIELLEKILKYRKAPLIQSIKASTDSTSNFALKWNDDYKIGVEQIDDEHKQIVDHFEELYFNINNGHGLEYYEQLLSFLEMYVNRHFEHEEKLQNEISYDYADYHKKLHEDFKSQINHIIETHKINEVTNPELIRLTLYIKEWLVHHILVEDKKIAFFLINRSH